MSDAPTPAPDLERHPRTKITRLPYLVIVLIALVLVGVFGFVTWRDRLTSSQEMAGLQNPAVATEQAIANPPPPAPVPQPEAR
jgi:nitrate reductase NapE component